MTALASETAPNRTPPGADTDLANPLNPILWLIAALWQYKWLIVTVVTVGVVAAAFLALRIPDNYTAGGLLEINPRQTSLLDDNAQDTQYIPPETLTETEVQVIRSYSVLSRVVDTLDLEYSSANPLLGEARSTGAPTMTRESARNVIVSELRNGLSVQPTGRSFIVDVRYEAGEPAFAAEVVNAVMASYLGVEVNELRSRARDAVTALSDRLEALRTDLDRREQDVQDFRSRSRVTEGAGTDLLAEQLTRVNEELIRAQSALAVAAATSRQGGQADAALPEVVNSPLIQTLQAQAAEQEKIVSELAAIYRASHPRLIQARDALAVLRNTIVQETAKIAASLQTSEAVQSERVAALRSEVETLRDQLNEQRAAELELRRLEREAEASRRIYETFLNRFNEVQGTEGLERPRGRIVAAAVPPTKPSGPNRLLVVAGGGILSGAAAFALVVGLALLDARIRTRADLSRATGIPPVAVVPPVPRGRGRRARRRNAAFAEAITHLRAALILGSGTSGPMAIALTAADGAAGHNALSMALGQACAIAGDTTVLVDADFTRPSAHVELSGSNEFGLSDLLQARGDVDAALQLDPASPLQFIAPGRLTDATLFRSVAMADLLNALYVRFDVVLVNLPPLLDQPEAQALAGEADVTALVARAGVSERASLTELVSMLHFAGRGHRVATVLIRR
ncbi:exopolysaccharide transport family protein [Acuticoccus sp. M5D2P5]|uniref:GumC family protein n=1 Tax=Acuticoccus kalidii TaxID=2910977 RepID=UPI001F462105|nr:exopolysaccharide transport family protein [Acuticoccus kalidii]MCF3931940.1 exopolysaccharide transport family protein [Acuticoccus kalidii]